MKLTTLKAIANYIGLSPGNTLQCIGMHKLPAGQVGSHWLADTELIDLWLTRLIERSQAIEYARLAAKVLKMSNQHRRLLPHTKEYQDALLDVVAKLRARKPACINKNHKDEGGLP